MAFNVGDRVVAVVSGHRRRSQLGAMRPPRHGEIAEVLRGDTNPRYAIRWDEGNPTVFTPSEGGLKADPARRAKPRRGAAS